MNILSDLDRKDFSIENLVKKALEDEMILSVVLKGILSKKDTIRYNSFKVLEFISEEYPKMLYQKWESLLRSVL